MAHQQHDHEGAHMAELIGALAARSGGSIEVPEEEMEAVRRRYGIPAPVLMGQDERGTFARICTLDDMVEEFAPTLARMGGISMESARALGTAMQASWRAAQAIRRERGHDLPDPAPRLTGVEAMARARELVDRARIGMYADREPGWSFRVSNDVHEALEEWVKALPISALVPKPDTVEEALWGYPVVIDPEAPAGTLELRQPITFPEAPEAPAGCSCLGGAYGVHHPPCQYAEARPFA